VPGTPPAVKVGTTVHDSVAVSAQPNTNGPVPTGNVVFHWWDTTNTDLSGCENGVDPRNNGVTPPEPDTSAAATLTNGTADSVTDLNPDFAFTPTIPGLAFFQATYEDDAVYNNATSDCEPLQVVDARIFIRPDGTNAVGTNHTFTCRIEVATTNAAGVATFVPVGTPTRCDTTKVAGPGNINGTASTADDFCNTIGATGECTVTATSAVTGLTEVSACTDVTVAGVLFDDLCTTPISPDPDPTDCVAPGTIDQTQGEDALKCWVNARISITPDGTNRVVPPGTAHTFTCLIEIDNGSGTFVTVGDGQRCDVTKVSGPGEINAAGGADDFCLVNGNDGNCTVTGSSGTTGFMVVQACTDVTVQGVLFDNLCTTSIPGTIDVDDCVPNTTQDTNTSQNALKCWINARIGITPNGTNPVDTNHVFTCKIQVEVTPTTFVNVPAGTPCTVTITNAGSVGTLTGTNPCLTVNATGACAVTDSSPDAGVDEVQACTTFTYLGVTFTNLCTMDRPDATLAPVCDTENPEFGINAVKCWEEEVVSECHVLWDEDALDEDMKWVIKAAKALNVKPDKLINENKPLEKNNISLLWNTIPDGPGDIVRLPTGQVSDEGWFMLPPEIQYYGKTFTNQEAINLFGGTTGSPNGAVVNDAMWFANFNILPQQYLDKIFDVQPLRDHDIANMIGMKCTALVWDSDISMNYNNRRSANLQGARLGFFTFTILDVVNPQAAAGAIPPLYNAKIPESTSDRSLYDVIIRVEGPNTGVAGAPVNNMLIPDAVTITSTSCVNGTLTVRATSDKAGAQLTISIETLSAYDPEDFNEMPKVNGFWQEVVPGVNCSALQGKIVTVSSDGDMGLGTNNAPPAPPGKWGSGGNYNKPIGQ
jgi:hypothetical protein